MTPDLTLKTRRDFLRSGLAGAALTWTVPTFLAGTFRALAEDADGRPADADAPVLVVVQMAGGNDGLNTVIPFANDDYHRARPRLAIPAAEVLKLNDELGLHPALQGLRDLREAGHLGLIQGVGYPNPNRSHFRSMEIWQTASDAEKFERTGWIGRYFDHACAGADATVGVNVGGQLPQAFAAATPKGITLAAGRRPASPGSAMMAEAGEDEGGDMAGGSIGMLAGGRPAPAGGVLDYLDRTALDARVSAEKVGAILAKAKAGADYPASALAQQFRLVAQLIAGGLPARVYYVSQGGYDTHTNQAQNHARLLGELGDALRAFTLDLKAQGNLGRVLTFTFSEFGRRVGENASGGTDHGAAGPMFFIAEKPAAPLLGRHPELTAKDLHRGDLKHNVDFRSVYAGVVEGWLRTPSEKVLGGKFTPLRLV